MAPAHVVDRPTEAQAHPKAPRREDDRALHQARPDRAALQRLHGSRRVAVMHSLQRSGGNAATARLLGVTRGGPHARDGSRGAPAPVATSASVGRDSTAPVQRCGATGQCGCGCSHEADDAVVQRQAGDATTMSITPGWAGALSDVELAEQIRRVAAQVSTSAADDPVRTGAEQNLRVLRQERSRRGAAALATGPTVPRPAGLPLDGGYRLEPATDLPDGLADALPEGQIVTVELETGGGAAGGPGGPGGGTAGPGGPGGGGGTTVALPDLLSWVDSPTDVTEPLAAGAASGLHHGNAALRTFGFAAAGDNAIGLVAIPRVSMRPGRVVLPDVAAPLDAWGHTAVVVRQNGRIVAVRGFNPDAAFPGGLVRLLRESSAVEAGRSSLPAVISADDYLFTHPRATSIEWRVDADMADRALAELSPTGPAGQLGHAGDYTARPAQFRGTCTNSNCVLWAVEQAEARLGGPVGRAGQGSITALGSGGAVVPRTGGQGQFMGMLAEAGEAQVAGRPSPLGPMPNAEGPAVVSGMPTRYRLLKVGGRVMVVVGLAADAYELVTASEAERPRVATGIAGGALGGFAAGAAAGLVCGPGALVCSIVFGAAGALGGRALFQAIYDSAPGAHAGPCIPAYRNLAPVGEGECPSCHRIRRVQECRDEAFQFDLQLPGGRGPLGQLGPFDGNGGGPGSDRLRSHWSQAELDALYGVASQRGAPQPAAVSAEDMAAISAWINGR